MNKQRHYLPVLGGLLLALGLSGYPAAQPVEVKPEGSHVSLTGTIVSKTIDSFILDYGEGTITVEVDDWDSEAENTALRENDKVTVYGKVDDDFYQLRTIEAETIFMEHNPLDDKGFQRVDVGDYVHVNGELSTHVFEKREVIADSIITFG